MTRSLFDTVYAPWHWLGFRRHPITVGIVSLAVFAGVAVGFAYLAGEGKVLDRLGTMNESWLAVCVLAEIVAYLGYVLAVHETARVDGGPKLGLRKSAHVVAAGFGAFFAATAAGGFEVDYWALRRAGATRRDALCRVLGLGTLEYAILAPAALGAALALLAAQDTRRIRR